MQDSPKISRRSFFKGEAPSQHHISSAVVMTHPSRREEIGRRIAAMPGVEVHAGEGSRIVITIEGPTSGMLGETLIGISTLDGVISANMVFEHMDEDEEVGS